MDYFIFMVLPVWIIGWMVTVGWLGASRKLMSEAVRWRLLQVVLAVGCWPIMLGADLHRALRPSDTVEDY